jgi:hypothetical protein
MDVEWLHITGKVNSAAVNTGMLVKIHHYDETEIIQLSILFVTTRTKALLCFSRITEAHQLL